ncbi:MAG: Fic family protein [Lentisphaeria bacterium]|jgi:Fic family protein
MDARNFKCPKAGRVVKTATGYTAFIPAPLPPKLVYDGELVLRLSTADTALSELSGVGRLLPNPNLLISPLVRREAVLSSRIEGTRATLSDVLLDEAAAPGGGSREADLREVRNYVVALEYGVARLGALPLSLRLVCELHAKLMAGVRGNHATPGEFRRSQNWIGPAGSSPESAPYVPPPPEELMACLGQWELFLHERERLPVLIQCALMHEQFEAIHPFLDGNGRIGRLLVTLFLMERGRLRQPLLYLSDFIEAHRLDYYDLLQRVRTHGDWNAWLRFFLTGVAEIAEDAARRATRLLELREQWRRQFAGKAYVAALLDQLFVNPYITVATAAATLKSSTPTASRALGLLEAAGILREISGRKWGRIWLAGTILGAIQEQSA